MDQSKKLITIQKYSKFFAGFEFDRDMCKPEQTSNPVDILELVNACSIAPKNKKGEILETNRITEVIKLLNKYDLEIQVGTFSSITLGLFPFNDGCVKNIDPEKIKDPIEKAYFKYFNWVKTEPIDRDHFGSSMSARGPDVFTKHVTDDFIDELSPILMMVDEYPAEHLWFLIMDQFWGMMDDNIFKPLYMAELAMSKPDEIDMDVFTKIMRKSILQACLCRLSTRLNDYKEEFKEEYDIDVKEDTNIWMYQEKVPMEFWKDDVVKTNQLADRWGDISVRLERALKKVDKASMRRLYNNIKAELMKIWVVWQRSKFTEDIGKRLELLEKKMAHHKI